MKGILSDQELMTRITEQDTEALKLLYDRYEQPAYRFAYRMVQDAAMAEEVMQLLYSIIWKAEERFDGNEWRLTDWLFMLTRRIAVDLLRKKRSRTPEQVVKLEDTQDTDGERINTEMNPGSGLGSEAGGSGLGHKVKAAVDGLNKDQKQVIEWIYYQGYTQREISDVHAIPQGTVQNRAQLAMKQLRQLLRDEQRGELDNE